MVVKRMGHGYGLFQEILLPKQTHTTEPEEVSSLKKFCLALAMAVKFELWFTQTPTMVVFLCTLLVAVAVSGLELGTTAILGGLLRLLHLGAFSAWLGTQVWVTFYAGRLVCVCVY